MRRHGWQLPYHPLQVVSIAVFLALGFAFYVFFAPFVGKKLIQHVALGIYTPLIFCVFLLYIWCAATDPGDAGVLKSNKYLGIEQSKECRRQEESTFEADCRIVEDDPANKGSTGNVTACLSPRNYKQRRKSSTCKQMLILSIGWCPLLKCSWQEQSSEQNASEDGMFYCSLCKVEVSKFSKHCRVCDKCVNGFDHHCRWLNNCIGRRNYGRFFILMAAALLLLIFQWSVGIEVLILCFLEQKQFKMDIVSKLGSSFSLVPFVIVVTSCTILAILATLPLAQLFFFHVLLIKKGISTYDYIIALRELEQQGNGAQQSPQMSPVSSLTGLSSASSLNAFRRAAWCTPPRLFLEDQFDIVSQEASMPANFTGMKATTEEQRKKGAAAVKISPWALAKLNVEEVSKVAAEARKRSNILKPILRQDMAQEQETDSSFGSDSGRFIPKSNPNPPLAKICYKTISSGGNWSNDKTNKLAPLQLEARSAFTASRAMSSSGIAAISPDSSLGSPEIHPFRVSSSSTVEEERNLKLLPPLGTRAYSGIQLSRSNSDGYDASGGEDSDQFPSGIIPRSVNWNSLPFNSGRYSIE